MNIATFVIHYKIDYVVCVYPGFSGHNLIFLNFRTTKNH